MKLTHRITLLIESESSSDAINSYEAVKAFFNWPISKSQLTFSAISDITLLECKKDVINKLEKST